jgi:hypothetical protein
MEQATKFEATGAEEPLFCWEDLSEEDLLELDEALVLSPLQPLPTARLEQAPLEYLAQAPAPARPRAAKRPRRSNDRLGSPYRGVSFQGRTGRCEAHIWVRGTQVYLGSFFCAEAAAAAYDLAAVSPPAAPPSRLPHRMPVLPGLRRSRCTPLLARALLFNVACTAPAF